MNRRVFNPDSVKILLFFSLSLSRLSPYKLSVIGGDLSLAIHRLSLSLSLLHRGMFARSMKPGPVQFIPGIVKDAVIKEWRKQLELVFCVDPPPPPPPLPLPPSIRGV